MLHYTIIAAQGHRQSRGCFHLPQPGAGQCGNRTASAPPALRRASAPTQYPSLCFRSPPSLPPSLQPAQVPGRREPYSRQCHPLPALLGDQGDLAGRVLPVALAKGKKGQDPHQEGAARARARQLTTSMCWGPVSGKLGWNQHPKASELCPSPRVPRCLACGPPSKGMDGEIREISPHTGTTSSPAPAQFLPHHCPWGSCPDRAGVSMG